VSPQYTQPEHSKFSIREIDFMFDKIKSELFSLTDMSLRPGETSDETLARVIGAYELARKLRQLRLRKKIGLTDLAKHTGLSPSMLSQLETGKLTPTIPTLARIAMVFDVGLEHFFARRAKRVFTIVRREERMRFPERPDLPRPSFFFECLSYAAQGKAFEVYLAEFPLHDGKSSTAHQHDGAEFIYILEGALAVRFDEEEHVLQTGDSVYFDSTEPHAYLATGGGGPARAMIVTSPPRA
jgi:transcriptional regulator with XRE-family HTH domain